MNLTKEQSYLINILKDHINGNKTIKLNENINWNLILKYSQLHQVAAIVYFQCKDFMPLDDSAKKEYAASTYYYVNRKNNVSQLKKLLQNIENIQVKGFIVAELYPVPSLRTMGDVDTLIHSYDQPAVHKILLKNGYAFEGASRGEWKYKKSGFIFEIHEQLVHDYKGKEKLIKYFSYVWDYVKGGELDWNFHFVYLIEHLRQHLVGEGVGFRQFMDIAVICQKVSLNWQWIFEQLKIIELYEFVKKVFAFNKRWFDIDPPIDVDEIDEEFFDAVTLKIFADGVFGHNNAKNKNTGISLIMEYEGLSYNKAKIKYLFRKVFPGYENTCKLPYCSYVKKSAMFYPIALVHRLIYRGLNNESQNDIKNELDRDLISKRVASLKQWGLL